MPKQQLLLPRIKTEMRSHSKEVCKFIQETLCCEKNAVALFEVECAENILKKMTTKYYENGKLPFFRLGESVRGWLACSTTDFTREQVKEFFQVCPEKKQYFILSYPNKRKQDMNENTQIPNYFMNYGYPLPYPFPQYHYNSYPLPKFTNPPFEQQSSSNDWKPEFSVGDSVEVKWRERWYGANVVQILPEKKKYQVKYKNYSDYPLEEVDTHCIRAISENK